MQTIKSVARRRWRPEDADKRFSWYEPISDDDAIRRAVHYVLARPGIFLNTSSDATLLPIVLEAAGLAARTAERRARWRATSRRSASSRCSCAA